MNFPLVKADSQFIKPTEYNFLIKNDNTKTIFLLRISLITKPINQIHQKCLDGSQKPNNFIFGTNYERFSNNKNRMQLQIKVHRSINIYAIMQ